MWHIASATKARKDLIKPSGSLLRSVINSSSRDVARRALSSSSSPDVAVQLDYFMSHQFAGVATALVDGLYASAGIEPHFLPTCPVGLEMANVRAYQDANPSTLATLGSVEQNIFTPLLHSNPGLRVTGVASMMRQSPLCVASLKELNQGDTIGCHEDTVDLLKRIYPQLNIVASPRGTKNSDLLNGTYDGIQAYTTTEVPALQRMLNERGMDPGGLHVSVLEDGVSGVKLGYSQLLFAADEGLSSPDRREATTAFLQSTFDGWQISIRDPARAIEAVAEAQRMLKLDDEANDHWHPSDEFQQDMLRLMNDQVKETYAGDRLGVLHEKRWSEATTWLLGGVESASDNVDPTLGLDKTGLWQPSSQLLHGNELGKEIMQTAKSSAYKFDREYGRKPSLGVVTVGQLKRYEHGSRRLELYSNPSSSWFNKTDAGKANGFEVQEINLDASTTTTETLLSEIYKLHDEVDGIQIMWPLPEHIDSSAVFNAVPLEKDVDGIHYVGQKEIGNCRVYAPVTPAGAVELMKAYGVDVAGKHVLVVGRSPIVGSPVSRMLRDMGAAVTVGHKGLSTDALKNLVGSADVVVTCAGDPSAVHADWLKDGCEVVNIGTTFCEDKDSLLSDVEGDIVAKAKRYSPVPGGVGPLSNPILFRNVAKAAWDQAEGPQGWNKEPSKLT